MRGYPNLELIEYICKQAAYKLYPKVLENVKYPSFRMQVFTQTWANTATGFDLENYASGQAFTDEYTTVVEISWSDETDKEGLRNSKNKIYGVFFGNEPAYMFINPNKKFFKDLEKHDMKSQKNALESYA